MHGSAGAALNFFRWLGLPAFNPLHQQAFDPVKYYQEVIDKNFASIKVADDLEQLAPYKANIRELVESSYLNSFLKHVEEVIHYEFKQKYYLGEYLV